MGSSDRVAVDLSRLQDLNAESPGPAEDGRVPGPPSAALIPAAPLYRALPRGRLHLPVARQIAERIVGRQIAEGEALPSEQELALQFGVSRTVIRAALGLLESQGLVDISHGKRSTVQPEPEWNVLDPAVLALHARVGRLKSLINDIFHTRLALEVAAAEEAAERATPAMLDTLGELCDTLERGVRDGGAFDYPRCDAAFHRVLADAAANRVLTRVLRNLTQAFRTISEFNPLHLDEMAVAGHFHRTIYEAVQARDPAAAAAAMREHILWAWHRWDTV